VKDDDDDDDDDDEDDDDDKFETEDFNSGTKVAIVIFS
jgi:hypothetical protein